MKIALVTYDRLPELTPDDQILYAYLKSKGLEVTIVIWNDPNVQWLTYDQIIIRSTWDYFEYPDVFKDWLTSLELMHAPVLNPLSILQWNMDKNYFDQFSSGNFRIPPYQIVKKNSNTDLHSIIHDNDWKKAVVKPTIAGGAYNTWVTQGGSSDQLRLTTQLKQGDVIIQKYIEEISTRGEVSLIYFDKQYSHAILKRPQKGDFRVQSQYGGSIEKYFPTPQLLYLTQSILESIPEDLLYARIDGIVNEDGTFLLMELELIEPNLFFAFDDQAPHRFYQALQSYSN